MKTYQNFIGGEWVGSTAKKRVPNINPANSEEVLGEAPLSTHEEATAAAKIAPALVAGNTVVFKPATLTPETAGLVVQCFADAGLPPGVLNMVYGSGGVVGTALIDHPATRAVSFTGSTEIGLDVYQRAA